MITIDHPDDVGNFKGGDYDLVTNHKRDWIHVHDVCKAIRFLAPSAIRYTVG